MSEYKPEDLERVIVFVDRLRKLILEDSGVDQQFLHDAVAMLRDGAQAMRDLEAAQARVKELEKMFTERELKRAENRMVYSIPAMDEDRAALQVKP